MIVLTMVGQSFDLFSWSRILALPNPEAPILRLATPLGLGGWAWAPVALAMACEGEFVCSSVCVGV